MSHLVPEGHGFSQPDADDLRAIGEALRETRERRGEDLYAIAEFLKIKPAYLYAVEEGAFDQTPGRAYALGFLRSYAHYLDLDAEKVVEHVKAALESADHGAVEDYPAPIAEDRAPRRWLVAASFAVIVAGFVGWSQWGGIDWAERFAAMPAQFKAFLDGDEPPAPLEAQAAATGAPSGVAALLREDEAEAALALPSSARPSSASAASAAERIAGVEEAPAAPEPTLPLLQADVVTPLIGLDMRGDALAAGLTTPPRSAAASAATPTADGGNAQPGRVSLVANAESWVKIYSADEAFVRERILAPGESLILPDRRDLALWTGNAAGLEVVLDGQSLGPLDASALVLRGVSMSPADLRRRLVVID